jgi:hypothetical protein
MTVTFGTRILDGAAQGDEIVSVAAARIEHVDRPRVAAALG